MGAGKMFPLRKISTGTATRWGFHHHPVLRNLRAGRPIPHQSEAGESDPAVLSCQRSQLHQLGNKEPLYEWSFETGLLRSREGQELGGTRHGVGEESHAQAERLLQ